MNEVAVGKSKMTPKQRLVRLGLLAGTVSQLWGCSLGITGRPTSMPSAPPRTIENAGSSPLPVPVRSLTPTSAARTFATEQVAAKATDTEAIWSGGGRAGFPFYATNDAPNFYLARQDPSGPADTPQQGDECSPGGPGKVRTINRPIDAQQAAVLKEFLAGREIERIDPLKNNEKSTIKEGYVSFVCSKDKKTSFLYGRQGSYVAIGAAQKGSFRPFGKDVRERTTPPHVLLNGGVVTAMLVGNSLLMVGADKGRFYLTPEVGDPTLVVPSFDPITDTGGAVTAAFATTSGSVIIMLVNTTGRFPNTPNGEIHPTDEQVLVTKYANTPEAIAQKQQMEFALNNLIGHTAAEAGIELAP